MYNGIEISKTKICCTYLNKSESMTVNVINVIDNVVCACSF